MLLWVPGLLFLLFNRDGRRYRVLGIIYLTAFAILLANPHSKAEYLGPAYLMLFAAGAVAVERWASRGRRGWAVASLGALSVLTSLLMLPLAVPVLPVETFIKYSAAIGMKPALGGEHGALRAAAVLRRHVRLGRAGEGRLGGLHGAP